MTSRPHRRRASRALLTSAGLTVSVATGFALIGTTASASPMATGANDGSPISAGPVSSVHHGRRTIAAKPSWVTKTPVAGLPAAGAKQQLTITLATDQAGALAYAKSVSDPSSANYRKFLTPKEFGKKFGAGPATVKAAKKWLRAKGFTVGALNASRTFLTATATTRTLDRAFGVRMRTFTRDGAKVTAPTRDATVPAHAKIAGVVGLDTTPRYHTDHVSEAQLMAKARRAIAKKRGITLPDGQAPATDSIAGNGCSNYWGQYVRRYQEPNAAPFTRDLPTAMCGYTPKALNKVQKVKGKQTGKNVTVGIVLWCDAPTIVQDTNKWAENMGVPKLKSGQLTIAEPSQPYDSYCDTNGASDYVETALDVQSVHGAAPDADIIYAPATAPMDAPLIKAFHRIVDNNSVDIITDSWGGAEAGLDDATKAAYKQVFVQAAAQGITIVFSSGDSGDGSTGDGTDGPSVAYPASDPWITSIGGTNIGTRKNGKKKFESGWITSVSTEMDGQWSDFFFGYGGGGGTSQVFGQPYYQKGVVPAQFAGSANPMRVYPDLSNLADPATGYLVGYTDTNGNYTTGSVGGTSLAAPRTAGQLALAIQKAGGRRLGFINPVIYRNGAKYLTDLKSNATKHAYLTFDDSMQLFGIPPIPETVVLNGQKLIDQSLTLQKGYDNLSGMGAIDNQRKLMKLVNRK